MVETSRRSGSEGRRHSNGRIRARCQLDRRPSRGRRREEMDAPGTTCSACPQQPHSRDRSCVFARLPRGGATDTSRTPRSIATQDARLGQPSRVTPERLSLGRCSVTLGEEYWRRRFDVVPGRFRRWLRGWRCRAVGVVEGCRHIDRRHTCEVWTVRRDGTGCPPCGQATRRAAPRPSTAPGRRARASDQIRGLYRTRHAYRRSARMATGTVGSPTAPRLRDSGAHAGGCSDRSRRHEARDLPPTRVHRRLPDRRHALQRAAANPAADLCIGALVPVAPAGRRRSGLGQRSGRTLERRV